MNSSTDATVGGAARQGVGQNSAVLGEQLWSKIVQTTLKLPWTSFSPDARLKNKVTKRNKIKNSVLAAKSESDS